MDSNGMQPDPESWAKQLAVYFHGVGYLFGIAFLLGMKYVFWGWISKIWAAFADLVYRAISGKREAGDDGIDLSADNAPETQREKRLQLEREKDQSEFHDFLDELNKRAMAEITRLEVRIRMIEQERDHKDKELFDIRARCETLEANEAPLRHAIRNARMIADAVIETYNNKVDAGIIPETGRLPPQVWKELK